MPCCQLSDNSSCFGENDMQPRGGACNVSFFSGNASPLLGSLGSAQGRRKTRLRLHDLCTVSMKQALVKVRHFLFFLPKLSFNGFPRIYE